MAAGRSPLDLLTFVRAYLARASHSVVYAVNLDQPSPPKRNFHRNKSGKPVKYN